MRIIIQTNLPFPSSPCCKICWIESFSWPPESLQHSGISILLRVTNVQECRTKNRNVTKANPSLNTNQVIFFKKRYTGLIGRLLASKVNIRNTRWNNRSLLRLTTFQIRWNSECFPCVIFLVLFLNKAHTLKATNCSPSSRQYSKVHCIILLHNEKPTILFMNKYQGFRKRSSTNMLKSVWTSGFQNVIVHFTSASKSLTKGLNIKHSHTQLIK